MIKCNKKTKKDTKNYDDVIKEEKNIIQIGQKFLIIHTEY